MNKEAKVFIVGVLLLSIIVSVDDYFWKKRLSRESSQKADILKVVEKEEIDLELEIQDSDFAEENKEIEKKQENKSEDEQKNDKKENKNEYKDITTGEKSDIFLNVPLKAHAVYVFNLNKNTEIFGKNASIKFPLASIAKLITALTALENFTTETEIAISESAVGREGESGLFVNEKWRLIDLIDAMLVNSLNDAAYAISEKFALEFSPKIITEFMNKKAENLGTGARFNNSSGLDINGNIAGAYGSAKDVSIFLKYILENNPRILQKTKEKSVILSSLSGERHEFLNTNVILGDILGIIAGKTGYTNLSGGNLAVIFEKTGGDKFIIVVLKSSYDGRFEDVKSIIDVIKKYNL